MIQRVEVTINKEVDSQVPSKDDVAYLNFDIEQVHSRFKPIVDICNTFIEERVKICVQRSTDTLIQFFNRYNAVLPFQKVTWITHLQYEKRNAQRA